MEIVNFLTEEYLLLGLAGGVLIYLVTYFVLHVVSTITKRI